MRIDKFMKVSRLIKRRTVANEVADAGRITVNGKPVKASYAVKEGDVIEVAFGQRPVRVKVVSTEAPMLPVVWAVPMFWTQATLAPAATAEWAADRPDSPAPTTTMSYSRVSAKSVMGSGACRNAGSPASAEPVSASVAVSAAVFGAQPARALAPTTPAAARPVNLN